MNEKDLKGISNCVRCGYCQAYCPTYRVTKHEGYNARGRMQLAKEALINNEFSELFSARINQCLLCGSCLKHCPPEVDVPSIIEKLRCKIIEKNGLSQVAHRMKQNAGEKGSITGDEQSNRLLWLQPCSDKIQIKFNEKVEYVYFVGCVSALYPSSYSIPQSFVQVLSHAGVDFSLLGEAEHCCGYPLAIGGLEKEAAAAAEKNIEAVIKLGAKAIVVTCPSCYCAWTNYYPELLGYDHGIEVLHSSELLWKLVEGGQLELSGITDTVTYHDPCDLGRKSGVFDAPRNLIRATGATLAEMVHSHEEAMCCGGGGNLESNDATLSLKVAQERVKQCIETGASLVVSGCQQCKRTLQGGARSLRARIKVLDIVELVAIAIK